MEFTFLGTSSGAPTKSRNVSCLALSAPQSKSWYMVDCGEGTQHQLLHTNLSLHTLKAIFITHIHGDHCYGLPGLLGSAALGGRTEPLTIVCPEAVADMVRAVQKTTRLWLEFDIEYVYVEQIEGRLAVDDYLVEPTQMSHRVPSWGYTFIEKHVERALDSKKLQKAGIKPGPVWGLLQKGENATSDDGQTIVAENYLLRPRTPRSVFVGGDNDKPQLLSNISIRPDVVIHESTYTEDIFEKVGVGPQHSCAKMVAEYAQSASIANLVLTHFSSRYGYNVDAPCSIKDVEDEAQKYYQGRLFTANDFDVYGLDKNGNLKLNHSGLNRR